MSVLAEGRHEGRRWHQSLKTTDARTAAQLVQRVILTARIDTPQEAEAAPASAEVAITGAIEGFYTEQRSQGASPSTIKSFRKFLDG